MGFRPERLAAVIKRDLGQIIQRSYQPSGTFVTVTNVVMTDDLSIAKVYLSVFSPGRDDKPVYEFIDEHIDQIRYDLASKIKNQVRKIPELHFYEDDTAEYVNKMEQLLKKVDIPEEDPDSPSED
ncbi:MAG: 30S ribosome-binding factor RbfA [Gracilimonas sp.]|jgi:ribosome-binding factor A|uniref:Ribosome-binding factor A n=1 Tax=Gracilimonas sediminicola TaxID=2952158 RepID=A0A9X2RGU9_9BACT|nr:MULTISPECIES: 30S ribosome-binding factor RbfA [Gracilimonas]MBO6586290.1 30S ribosome-binding factor RbfA [Gracilimonas sp.]MBO6614947.1 30S ribosome-binding factor RbfA [Gracilimonas sp.]MCP9292617.1 30S ribosome-binding factor RbfA [Gracilimonas sediminicola]